MDSAPPPESPTRLAVHSVSFLARSEVPPPPKNEAIPGPAVVVFFCDFPGFPDFATPEDAGLVAEAERLPSTSVSDAMEPTFSAASSSADAVAAAAAATGVFSSG